MIENKPSYEALELRIKDLELLLLKTNSNVNTSFLKASPDAIIISDLQGNILTLSDAAKKLININCDAETIGLSIFDFLDGEDKERALKSITQMFNGIFTGPEVYLAKRPNGSKLFIEVNGEFLRDESGNPNGLIFIIRDVSSRQFAANELLKNHKFLTDLIENSGSLIYVKDLIGNYKLVNSKWEQTIGLNREDALGKRDEEIYNETTANQFINNDNSVISGNVASEFEEHIISPIGESHFISNKFPLKDELDQVIGVCNFSSDITELVSIREALKKKSAQFNNLVSKIPVGVFVIHSRPNGMFNFAFVSPPMAKIVGLSMEDILKDAMVTFNKIHPLDVDGFMNANYEAFQNLTPFSYTTRMIVGNEIRFCKIESFPDKLENGDALWNGLITDITEQRLAKEELALANTNLKKVIAEKDRFFSILAHDLRGPINGILALIEMVSEDFDEISREELRKMVVGMNTSASGVKRLLDNLLEWASMQQGKIDFQPSLISVATAVDSNVNISLNQAKLKNIEIVYDIDSNQFVFADTHMLDSILRNLISNAIKFTPKNGQITISSKINIDNFVEISIHDNGIGMGSSILNSLFISNEKNNRKGTNGEASAGLGLILCKDFVERHGGKIWAESKENEGSEFLFTIPQNKD
jgi:PAS domain S-box-containing protein